MKNRIPYRVPEGYFDGLESRLAMIPSERRWGFRTFAPYFAVVVAALAIFAFVLFGRRDVQQMDDMYVYEQYVFADLIPHTDPFLTDVSENADDDYLTQQ